MSLRDNELARRVEGSIELRPQPIRVRWNFNELITSDGHELRISFTCSARALPDPTERKMLEEVLLGSRYALTDDDLAAHFERTLNPVAATVGEKHTAAEWSGEEFKPELIQAVRSVADRVAFGCGVELLPPFQVELQCPSYQRQRLRSMQQTLAEQHTAGQMEHAQRAAELLKQFQSIRTAAPELTPGRVLDQISPGDRGAVLQTLLLAAAKPSRAEQLWAVAGPYLVRLDLFAGGPPRPQLFPLPPTLGPFRSVSAVEVDGDQRLALGARSGFMLLDPSNPTDPRIYSDAGVESPLGFNQVVYCDAKRGFAASHGDRGVLFWARDRTDAPASAIRPSRFMGSEPMRTSDSGSTHSAGPRNLCALSDHMLVFNAAEKLFLTDLEKVEQVSSHSDAEIVAILPDERQMLVVHEDGTLCGLDRASRALTCLSRRATRVRSAGALPWLGTQRLLLAGDDGPIACVGFDDPLLTEYQSVHRGMRVVTGSGDLVAGISADRQRLILWQSWDGRQPLTEVYLTGLTRHRIADIGFA
jgi:hypothetical protein